MNLRSHYSVVRYLAVKVIFIIREKEKGFKGIRMLFYSYNERKDWEWDMWNGR